MYNVLGKRDVSQALTAKEEVCKQAGRLSEIIKLSSGSFKFIMETFIGPH